MLQLKFVVRIELKAAICFRGCCCCCSYHQHPPLPFSTLPGASVGFGRLHSTLCLALLLLSPSFFKFFIISLSHIFFGPSLLRPSPLLTHNILAPFHTPCGWVWVLQDVILFYLKPYYPQAQLHLGPLSRFYPICFWSSPFTPFFFTATLNSLILLLMWSSPLLTICP